MLLQKLVHDSNHAPAQSLNRRVFPHIHARQLFRQHWLVASEKTPVRKVIGESLADEMMFLQRPECMLKNGIVGTSLQPLPQLREVCRSLTPDSQQVF